MKLLDHKKGVIRSLTQEEMGLIGQALTPDTDVFRMQQKLLLNWRDRHYWVECDCLDHTVTFADKPIMALRRLPSGLVVFALLPDGVRHDEQCYFYRMVKYKNYENGQYLRQNRRKNDYVFHRQVVEKAESDDEDKDPVSKSGVSRPSMPGLQRFLYNLSHAAKSHVMKPNTELTESAYLKCLVAAAHDFTINKHFRLADYLYTNLKQRDRAIYRLKATAKYWTGSAKPHCVFLILIDEVVKGEQGVILRRFRYGQGQTSPEIEAITLPAECDLTMPGRAVLNKSNPAIAVFTLTDVSITDTPLYEVAKALVLPVVSKANLMIVESGYERIVAKQLRKLQRLLAKACGTRFYLTIIKPLADLRAPISEIAVRPDFIIEYNNRKIILEVMGSHDEDYIERKSRTVSAMEEIAPVLEFDALQAEIDGELEAR